jgi:transcriptional regulator GlxA family with amidase domain
MPVLALKCHGRSLFFSGMPKMTKLRSIPPNQTIRIAAPAYRGCMPMQLFGMVDTLRIAADIASRTARRRLPVGRQFKAAALTSP